MTAMQTPGTNASATESPILSATEALRTGMFQPIENLDPDISPRIRINQLAPTFLDRILRRG